MYECKICGTDRFNTDFKSSTRFKKCDRVLRIKNKFKKLKEIPANTKESDEMSKNLKERGFKFVGTTICYAFMQAVGMTNDHIVDCFRYKQV